MSEDNRADLAPQRQNARGVLKEAIKRKGNDLDSLNILMSVIPWDQLSDEEEGKLWGYFIRIRD